MIPVIVELSGIPADKPVNQITRAERKSLVSLLKGLTLEITGSRPISEAIVTAGGVSTDEIDPATMESRLVKGLFAGEIIDVDGYTGGFNLTIALLRVMSPDSIAEAGCRCIIRRSLSIIHNDDISNLWRYK